MIPGAFYRRAIGGGWPVSRIAINVAYGGYIMGVAGILSGSLLTALLASLVAGGAHTGPLHGETMDRGHSAGTWITDSLAMLGRFTLWLLPLAWWCDGWLIVAPLALSVSVGYDIAYAHFRAGLLDKPTVFGEYWTGAMVEAAIIVLVATA